MKTRQFIVIAVIAMSLVGGCAKQPPANLNSASSANANESGSATAESVMPRDELVKPWKGDFDGMAQRRVIRALVVYNKILYFLDGAEQHGVSYDMLKEFENVINKQAGNNALKMHVAFIPVSRDELIPSLIEGRGDLVAANLSITDKRLESVDFTEPLITGINEIVVTGPSAEPITSLDDLTGKEVHVRKSSSFYESLSRLNEQFKASGKPLIKLKLVDEVLESEDILEMMNAELIAITVMDSHVAEFWSKVFDKITVHTNLALQTGGEIAWAFRKDSPQLASVVNSFVKDHKIGTSFGNQMLNRYLKNVDYIKNSTSEEEMKKFRTLLAVFQRYGKDYDFDYLMLGAQAYQESRLDQNLRSSAGAVGIMQIKPSTAADPTVGIKDVETNVENNVHAGVKYLRFVVNEYFKDASMNNETKLLFAFASYNAGPARIAKLRKQAEAEGLDPNKWFRNVEYVAAKEIGQETVQYVRNIYKYYVAYREVTAVKQKKTAAGTAKQN